MIFKGIGEEQERRAMILKAIGENPAKADGMLRAIGEMACFLFTAPKSKSLRWPVNIENA